MAVDRTLCDSIGARGRGLKVKVPPDPSAGGGPCSRPRVAWGPRRCSGWRWLPATGRWPRSLCTDWASAGFWACRDAPSTRSSRSTRPRSPAHRAAAAIPRLRLRTRAADRPRRRPAVPPVAGPSSSRLLAPALSPVRPPAQARTPATTAVTDRIPGHHHHHHHADGRCTKHALGHDKRCIEHDQHPGADGHKRGHHAHSGTGHGHHSHQHHPSDRGHNTGHHHHSGHKPSKRHGNSAKHRHGGKSHPHGHAGGSGHHKHDSA